MTGVTRGAAALLVSALVIAGCAAPTAGPPIPRAAQAHPVLTTTAPPTTPPRTPVPLGQGRSVRRSWPDASLTAEFCGVRGAVRFTDSIARAPSSLYSEVDLYLGRPTYGRLDPFGEAAALPVTCNNTGGTAAGDLGAAYVIVVERDGHLLSLAELVPQSDVGDRPSTLRGVAFRGDSIVAFEHWYRSEDATCCPSGTAETAWTPRAGTLVAQFPHLS